MSNAKVVRLVGFKDGVFVPGVPISTNVEPWFLIRCFFDYGTSSTLVYTKDAESCMTWTRQYGDHLRHVWNHEEHTIVKQAIERYVTEVV